MSSAPWVRPAAGGPADFEMTGPAVSPRSPDKAPDRLTRLALQEPATTSGERVSGGWWPRSREARAQLSELVVALNDRYGVVLRLAVDALAWDGIPHRITVDGHSARIRWLTDTNHVIVVTLSHHEHLQLLVVPPLTAERAALAALATSTSRGDLSAQEILELHGIETQSITRPSTRPIASAA